MDSWQRLFYQPECALPKDSEYVSRLSTINDALFRLRRFLCSYFELTMPVMPDEALRLMMPGCCPS
ncbi:hypothetical protein NITLEN_60179 [Nitrospira lenta]|uniref:Uncharacterized protein n=1 Tax=Nitrospira lenta TaxID=1436998 RepID=A0A330L941_9BACT|nr:hypothetical protein NITLEN_60179 [Nitrospira lenta]